MAIPTTITLSATLAATLAGAAAITTLGTVGLLILLWRTIRTARQWRHAATHDVLTGLPNRRALLDALTQELRSGRPVTVALVDLDNFKAINDSHGHHAGDAALQATARRLSNLPGRYTVGRFAGDEFLIITPGRLPDGLTIADHASAALVDIPASIGVALAHNHDAPDDLVRRADAALYHAKTLGKCVIPYHTGMTHHPSRTRS